MPSSNRSVSSRSTKSSGFLTQATAASDKSGDSLVVGDEDFKSQVYVFTSSKDSKPVTKPAPVSNLKAKSSYKDALSGSPPRRLSKRTSAVNNREKLQQKLQSSKKSARKIVTKSDTSGCAGSSPDTSSTSASEPPMSKKLSHSLSAIAKSVVRTKSSRNKSPTVTDKVATASASKSSKSKKKSSTVTAAAKKSSSSHSTKKCPTQTATVEAVSASKPATSSKKKKSPTVAADASTAVAAKSSAKSNHSKQRLSQTAAVKTTSAAAPATSSKKKKSPTVAAGASTTAAKSNHSTKKCPTQAAAVEAVSASKPATSSKKKNSPTVAAGASNAAAASSNHSTKRNPIQTTAAEAASKPSNSSKKKKSPIVATGASTTAAKNSSAETNHCTKRNPIQTAAAKAASKPSKKGAVLKLGIADMDSETSLDDSCSFKIGWGNESVEKGSEAGKQKSRLDSFNTAAFASYHCKEKRLQVGNIVKSAVGPRIPYSQAKQMKYGQILQSVGNNEYLVSFEDGIKRERHSNQLILPPEEEILPYKQLLAELFDIHNGNDEAEEFIHLPHPETAICQQDMPFLYDQGVEVALEDMMDIPDTATLSANAKSISSESTAKASTKLSSSPSKTKSKTKNKKAKSPSSSASKRKKATPTTKSNEGRVIMDEYESKLNEARQKIKDLINQGTTYTVDSSTDSMIWTVIEEHRVDPAKCVDIRLAQDIGIKDVEIREMLKESDLPLADLLLMLMYKDGEWEKGLEIMNRIITKCNEEKFRRKEESHRRVATFSKLEFLIAHAFIIGAADCSAKGEKLWRNKSDDDIEKQWKTFCQDTDFGEHMRYYRFKQFKQHFASIWQNESLYHARDEWWKIQQLISTFNFNRKDLILPCEVLPVDESMSAFRLQTTATGGLPKLSYIVRKPENLGTEFKCSVCPVTGVMLFLEIQRKKDEMKKLRHHEELGATAACTLRIAEGVTQNKPNEMGPTGRAKEIIIGDSWFGSVKAAVALRRAGFECVLQVKTNHALFPKKQIEEVLGPAPGGSSMVLRGIHKYGVELVSIGYKYNKKTVLFFVCTAAAGSTADGIPYQMKWTDSYGNVNIRGVPRSEVISTFFRYSNSVDVHNHLRQACLRLEKMDNHRLLVSHWHNFDWYKCC